MDGENYRHLIFKVTGLGNIILLVSISCEVQFYYVVNKAVHGKLPSFSLSGKVFILPSFCNDGLAALRILEWWLFSLCTLKMLLNYFLLILLLRSLLSV